MATNLWLIDAEQKHIAILRSCIWRDYHRKEKIMRFTKESHWAHQQDAMTWFFTYWLLAIGN